MSPTRSSQGSAALFVASMAAHFAPATPEQRPLLDLPLQAGFIDKLAATLPQPPSPQAAYSLSKIGVVRLCERRATAWGRQGARIVSLSPGMIETPMGLMEFEREPVKRQLLATSPIARQGTMDEIVDAAEFLLSDRASFMTGTDLLVDGGVVAARRHVGPQVGSHVAAQDMPAEGGSK
jgi:NAD(P)-dependent dehydrogenase (short-subunit alcohol dehydrogenase family)